ncbi:MAG: 2-phosphosulfolactate phosphatase [archaeon YNP-WB-040]|jgi:2-phosphosulfolactate phosphatase|nr:2-phosphosulfolactate phosphatase [Candidatus Culexarchaeum yellowstonense]
MVKVEICFGIGDRFNIPVKDEIVIVIDVLRASSTITTALANGALKVYVFREIGDAIDFHRRVSNCILAGERGGLRIEGFNLGNSPREFSRESVFGKYISFTSSNCARIVDSFKDAEHMILACFLNISSVCNYIRHLSSKYGLDVLLACAGRYGSPCSEDLLCAEVLRDMILGSIDKPPTNDFSQFLKLTSSGRNLIRLGFNQDVEYCGAVDVFDVIPVWDGEGFVAFRFKT